MRVLISSRPGGFSLAQPWLLTLWTRHPDWFDGPFDSEDFLPDGPFGAQGWPNGIIQDGKLYFLNENQQELRTDLELLALFDAHGSDALRGPFCLQLKVVEVPDDVAWHLVEHEDGSESIHENHRVWS